MVGVVNTWGDGRVVLGLGNGSCQSQRGQTDIRKNKTLLDSSRNNNTNNNNNDNKMKLKQ